MNQPKIICLGMNEESQNVITQLAAIEANIIAIAGLPAESSKNVSDFVDHSKIASLLGVPFISVDNINSAETLMNLRETKAELLFILGWSQLLSDEVINLFPMGVVGSHPSNLPERRGRAPISWTIIDDCRRSAVTLFRLTRGVDNGSILKQTFFDYY